MRLGLSATIRPAKSRLKSYCARVVWDGKVVNTVDDAPMTILELSTLAGVPMESTSTPLATPWSGVLDGSLAQSLGFKPELATTWQAHGKMPCNAEFMQAINMITLNSIMSAECTPR